MSSISQSPLSAGLLGGNDTLDPLGHRAELKEEKVLLKGVGFALPFLSSPAGTSASGEDGGEKSPRSSSAGRLEAWKVEEEGTWEIF